MAKDTDIGIYLFSDKTFYYLEAGDNFIGNTLDRVRKTLIQRGKIVGLVETPHKQSYEMITVKEARARDLKMQPVYISKHIQQLAPTDTPKQKGFK
jgi:hypothetical protein